MNNLIAILLLQTVIFSEAFNISPQPNYVFKEPTNVPTYMTKVRSSYFGFSVNLREKSIIVGAPRAQSSIATQRRINETGAVYKCDFQSGECRPFNFDVMGNTHVENSPFAYNSEKKDFQWLGAAMDGRSSELDRFVVCAPRIVTELVDYYLLHGICYWASGTGESTPTSVKKIIPMRQKNMQLFSDDKYRYYNYMYGEQGLSVHITENSEEILIGAPGVFNWRGSVVRYRAEIQDDVGGLSRRAGFPTQRYKRQNIEYVSDVPNPYLSSIPDDSYFGYAVSSGYFENSQKVLYVASAPQANMQTGEVHIFDIVPSKGFRDGTEIKTLYKFDGRQMGEYFGYALLTEDFNSDGLPDLAIAAPYHSKNSDYENGVVYIFMNEGRLNFRLETVLSSEFEMSGRFGITMSKIGDLNMDGFNDIAVSAPFEGNGAVYIFLGNSEGVNSKPSQKLISPEGSTLFGHGISRGVDIDNNGYNDIAIGSPDSEEVFVYKSYPVVKPILSIVPSKREIGINETSFQVKACWRYESQTELQQNVDITIQLKVDSQNGRAVFSDRSNTMEMNTTMNDINSCWDFDIFVKSSFADIFKPIYIDLSYKIAKEIPKTNVFCEKCVLADPNTPNNVREKITFITGCKEEKCASDIKLSSKFVDFKSPYVIGSTRTISIQYDIVNEGETAYLAQINVTIPSTVQFSKITSNCKLIEEESESLICDVGNGSPIFKGGKAKLIIGLDMTKVEGQMLSVIAEVFSTGDEINKDDNYMKDDIELKEFSDVEIIGKSSVSQISLEKIKGIIEVVNSFEVRNSGPSNFRGMIMNINVPIAYQKPGAWNKYRVINFNDISITGNYNNKNLDFTWSENNTILISNPDELSTISQEVDNIYLLPNNHDHPLDYEFMNQNGANFQNENTEMMSRRRKRSFSYLTNDIVEHEISKRSPSIQDDVVKQLPANRTIFFDCSNPNVECVQASINVENFKAKDALILITLTYKLDLDQIENCFGDKEDVFSVQIKSDLTKLDDEKKETFSVAQTNPFTLAYKQLIEKTPIWIYVASTLSGLFLFHLLSYGLYVCGFFKRSSKEEMEKLTKENKNPNDTDDE